MIIMYFYRIVKSYNIITTRRLLAYLTLFLSLKQCSKLDHIHAKAIIVFAKFGGMAALDPTMMTTGEKFHII